MDSAMANSTKARTGHPHCTVKSIDAITSPRRGMPISSALSRALPDLHRLHIASRLLFFLPVASFTPYQQLTFSRASIKTALLSTFP
jgi:hypothetical protein